MVEEEELSSADKLPLPVDDSSKSSSPFQIHRPALVRAAFHVVSIVLRSARFEHNAFVDRLQTRSVEGNSVLVVRRGAG